MTRKVTLKRLMPESRMAMRSPSAICPGTVTAVYTRLLTKTVQNVGSRKTSR